MKQWILKSSLTFRLLVITALVAVLCALLYINQNGTDVIGINSDPDSTVVMVGGGGERIYLSEGIIYAAKDDPDKKYYIVNGVAHATRKIFDNLEFFRTPEEAELAGYKPSENFARNYACWKEDKDWMEC